MKARTAIFLLAALAALPLAAAEASLDPELERFVRASIPDCGTPLTLTVADYPRPMPAGMTARVVSVDSASRYCQGQHLAVRARSGRLYVGMPWPIGESAGSIERKVSAFGYERLGQTFSIQLHDERSEEGLIRGTLFHTTDYGKAPAEVWVDPDGTILFPGSFVSPKVDPASHRLAALKPTLATAPSSGSADAAVSVVEFSDFQCPSCAHAAAYVPSLLEKYAGRIRYSRVDLPLIGMHPWAFPAAVMGRAVWMQNRDAFWNYKKAVYDAQAELNIFTIEEFARGFAADHGLDLARFDRDRHSEAVQKQILEGAGVATSLQIYGTPTFLVNGRMVSGGEGGENLEKAIRAALGE